MNGKILVCLIAVCLLVGTVSADTAILFANYDTHPYEDSNSDWSTMRNAAGDAISTPSTDLRCGYTAALGTEDQYTNHRRGIISFGNNATITGGSTINSATVSGYGYSKANGLGTVNFSIIDYTGANPATATDYSSTTFTRQADDLPYASFGTTGYNNIALTNFSSITIGGNTTLMFTHSADTDNSALVWASSAYSGFWIRPLEYDGASKIPYITVDFTPAAGGDPPVASFTKSKTLVVFPSTVTFDDTSTNTPTSWSWDMGDGRSAVTTENPTYQYLKRGLFKVILTATNDDGSDASDPQYVWVTGFPQLQTITPYRDPNTSVSLETATFTSSRPLSEEETLKVLKNMYGV